MDTKYTFPKINIAPPYGYKMSYRFSIEKLEHHLSKNKTTKLRTQHNHFKKGKLIKTVNSYLEFNGKQWIDKSGLYYISDTNCSDICDWNTSNEFEYIESNIEITSEGYFKNILNFQPPQNYALYFSNEKKAFISDGTYKYGATRTIDQMRSFGKWIEGYPDGNLSLQRNCDQSLILVNPYKNRAKIKIELIDDDKVIKTNYAVPSMCARRITLSSLLKNYTSWSGQILISGKFRLVFFILKHDLKGNNITTLEHSENYRGERTHYSLKETINKIKMKLKFG